MPENISLESLEEGHYGSPGPLRDKLVAAILSGEKTGTSSPLEISPFNKRWMKAKDSRVFPIGRRRTASSGNRNSSAHQWAKTTGASPLTPP